MLILAVDTAGDACSVALCDDSRQVAGDSRPMRHGHAEALLPMVARILDDAGVGCAAVDLFAVTIGPGAFTGLRIGIAAVAGLALVGGRPIVGICSFLAVAAGLPTDLRRGHDVLIAIDSRRGDPYLQLFDDGLRSVAPAWCGPPTEAAARLRDRPVLVAGSAAARVAEIRTDRILTLADAPATPSPAVIAALARDRRDHAGGEPPLPVYLRPPDARPPPPGRGIIP